MQFTPHDYQVAFLTDLFAWLQNGDAKETRRLYASPTGTGKSVMGLLALEALPEFVLVTPRLEIVSGMLAKLGVDAAGLNDSDLAALALEHRITTPIRFRNMLAKGEFPFHPEGVILDEAHHDLATTYSELSAYLGSDTIWIGLTATPFRGTAKGTAQLLDKWNGVTQVLSIAQAAERGCLSVPRPDVWPLVDDDTIEITNGEFVISALESAVTQSLDEIVKRCKGFATSCELDYAPNGEHDTYTATRWNRPTLFACPTTAVCRTLEKLLNDAGLPAACVTQDTPRAERNRIFADAMKCRLAVVQIDVVSEGVDLPFRRLIDLRPTMSPVKWMQQVGRITRPIREDETAPEYYCCNRNLERHGYLFEGAIPARHIADAQQAFKAVTNRAMSRAFGLETIGRFKAAELPFLDGCIGQMYLLTEMDAYAKTEYAAMVHPAVMDVLYAKRISTKNADGTTSWGKWQQIDALPDLTGYASAAAATLTPKQSAWWARDAAKHGLDPSGSKVNKRNFAALPLLKDLRFSVKGAK